MNKKFLALLLTSCSAYAGNSTITSVADANDLLNIRSHSTIKIEDNSNQEHSFIELPKAHGGYSSERIVVDNTDREHSFINITSVKNSTPSIDDMIETSKIIAHSPVTHRDEKTGQITVNKDFINNVSTYADMIDLSYHLVKGRNELTTSSIEKLFDNGWQITGFTGFSGLHKETIIYGHDLVEYEDKGADTDMSGFINFAEHKTKAANIDLSGFVAFNKSTGEAVVTFHGSQDKFDWQNNLDGQKIIAQENGLNFSGSVHKGINDRYQSSKKDIYKILNQFYEKLEGEDKDKFHITTAGHSLGGGMASLCYADLATDYAKVRFGKYYDNTIHNKVRALPVSAPRVFDSVAVDDLTHSVGISNVILDGVIGDPVTTSGPGKSVTKWLEESYRYGFTVALLKVANFLNIVPHSHPQALAYSHGDYMHLGQKALADARMVKIISENLDQEDLENPKSNDTPEEAVNYIEHIEKGFVKKVKNYAKNTKEELVKKVQNYFEQKFAHIHYGRLTPLGVGFEKGFVVGETLEQRLNDNIKNKNVPVPTTSQSSSWWTRVKNIVSIK